MKSTNFISVFGIPHHSMWEVSKALRSLNVSHAVRKKGPHVPYVMDLGLEQPRKVIITDHVRGVRINAVNFVIASYGELSETNYPLLPEGDIVSSLKAALLSTTQVSPKVEELKAMDYVDMVSKPSLLNNIQTVIYKIQPYALRKETNSLVMGYFNSKIPERTALQMVKRNMKTEALAPLLIKAKPLRDAVAMLGKMTAEEVSDITGVATFDLNYLTKSKK